MSTLLQVEDLNVEFGGSLGIWPVRDVSFTVDKGETLCIVGESGSGKSLTGLSLMGLLPKGATRRFKTLALEGVDIGAKDRRQTEDMRGRDVAMIFQEPMTSLNPAYTIGDQLEEVYRRHTGKSRKEARERALFLLEKVGIAGGESRLLQFPHQLSGGLRQRVMIAMGLMCNPKLIIADEPTTALDVTVQAQILRLLSSLQREFGMGMILITHDLGVVSRVADKVAVMYAGQIVETGTAAEIFDNPLHPYTRALLGCIPIPGRTRRGEHLAAIPGTVPALFGDLGGCHFRNRCAIAEPDCAGRNIALQPAAGGRLVRCIHTQNAARLPLAGAVAS